ncbi:MAG: hypothetical protein ACRD3V_17760 [Vicinamibacteria bacterium]
MRRIIISSLALMAAAIPVAAQEQDIISIQSVPAAPPRSEGEGPSPA